MDINNRFNEIISFFSPFNYEFLLGYRLVDIFLITLFLIP